MFSKLSAKQIRIELGKLNLKVPVHSVIHPTETPKVKFSEQLFINNRKKKIIQVGAWLRDNYAIFRLGGGVSPIRLGEIELHKSALIGKDMNNYYKPSSFFTKLKYETFNEKIPEIMDIQVFSSTNEKQKSRLDVNGFLPKEYDGICRGGHSCNDGICRDEISDNKYIKGAIKLLEDFKKQKEKENK